MQGPRALPEAHPTTNSTWNPISTTNPERKDNREKLVLHGPREMPRTRPPITENWNLMTVTNPLRRANDGRLLLRGPQPLPSAPPRRKPVPQPIQVVAVAFGPSPRERKAFESGPLVRQEVNGPQQPAVQRNQQLIGPNTIPPLPVSYRPVLAGRHPLRRPLPPIPVDTDPEQPMDCQPPPVPPHLVLPRREAIGMPMTDGLNSALVRYSLAPDAPVGDYFSSGRVHSGWQPPRCETVLDSLSEYQA